MGEGLKAHSQPFGPPQSNSAKFKFACKNSCGGIYLQTIGRLRGLESRSTADCVVDDMYCVSENKNPFGLNF